MLRISPEQLAAMRAIQAAPLVEELFEHICQRLGDDPPSAKRRRRLLDSAVETARRNHIGDAEARRGYALLVVRLGEDPGREPVAHWAEPVLEDPWLSDDEKVSSLEQAAAALGLLSP